jgi:hypothetical protein
MMADHPSSRYSDDERIAIEGWLLDGFSASRIAQEFIRKFQRYVSRNAIIGVIHRDPALMKIGLAGKGRPVAGSTKGGRGKVQKVVAARSRKASAPKARDSKPKASPIPLKAPSPPEPKPFVNFAAYDAGSRRLPLVDLGRHDCRFAVNDAAPGEEHLFCGQPVAPDSPYCPHHSTRAFNGFVSEAMRRGNIFRQRRIA